MRAEPRKRLVRRSVVAGLLLTLAARWARYFLTVPDSLYRGPAIVRALLRHRAEFDDFVERFRGGEVRAGPGRRYTEEWFYVEGGGP